MIEIVPSILTNDPVKARELLALCADTAQSQPGIIHRVSIDIIDGKFADNKTIDPSVFDDIETTLKLDFQLMVDEPINWIERCIRAGADRIIGHVEHMSNQMEFVSKVQENAILVGLGLDLLTPVTKLDSEVLANLDVVLVMSVQAGFGGQKFDPSAVKKIKELDEMRLRDSLSFLIHDDGGVTFDNIKSVSEVSADEISIGMRIFDGDLIENVRRFQKATV